VALHRATGSRIGELRCLVRLSRACRLLDDLDGALGYLGEAMPLADELGNEKWRQAAKQEQAALNEVLGSSPVHYT
jgi:hypothetical protein